MTALYHYTSIAAFSAIFSERALILPSAISLSDPADHSFAVATLGKLLKQRTKHGTDTNAELAYDHPARQQGWLEAELAIEMDEVRSQLGRYPPLYHCMSEGTDDPHLWRVFCPDGGVAIGWDVDVLMKHIPNSSLVKCVYEPNHYVARLEDEVRRVVEESAARRGGVPSIGDAGRSVRSLVDTFLPSIKHHDFRYEQESRLVVPDTGKPYAIRAVRGWPQLYLTFGHLPPEVFREVVVGPGPHQADVVLTLDRLLSRTGARTTVRSSNVQRVR